MMAEAESYIDRYDVFADVEYDEEMEAARFGSGRGDDVRVPVYEAEGLDPVRVVYIIRVLDGSLEEALTEWREADDVEEFFSRFLASAADHGAVDEAHLEHIIEAGYAHVEERQEARGAAMARQVALDRARRTTRGHGP